MTALEAGCKLAVIDIRATISSAKADRFLLIRPGTDYALNLSVIHVLLNQQRFDAGFAREWISDIEALACICCAVYPAVGRGRDRHFGRGHCLAGSGNCQGRRLPLSGIRAE